MESPDTQPKADTMPLPTGFAPDPKAQAFLLALQRTDRLATPAEREAARFAAVAAYRVAKQS